MTIETKAGESNGSTSQNAASPRRRECRRRMCPRRQYCGELYIFRVLCPEHLAIAQSHGDCPGNAYKCVRFAVWLRWINGVSPSLVVTVFSAARVRQLPHHVRTCQSEAVVWNKLSAMVKSLPGREQKCWTVERQRLISSGKKSVRPCPPMSLTAPLKADSGCPRPPAGCPARERW